MAQVEEGKSYLLEINGHHCKARLKEINRYSTMPSDYMFTAHDGEKPIISVTEGQDYFPIPQFMLNMMIVTPLD